MEYHKAFLNRPHTICNHRTLQQGNACLFFTMFKFVLKGPIQSNNTVVSIPFIGSVNAVSVDDTMGTSPFIAIFWGPPHNYVKFKAWEIEEKVFSLSVSLY